MSLGPKNETEARIYAEANLRVDFQHRLQKLCTRQKLCRKSLALRAGMTEAQVSRLFSANANPTLRTVARLFFALKDECILTSRELEKLAGRDSPDVVQWSRLEVAKSARSPSLEMAQVAYDDMDESVNAA